LLFLRIALLLGCAAIGLMAQTEDQPAEAEYGGPAILSRGENPLGQSSAPISFRPYIGLNGVYDSGVVPVSVTSTGAIPFTDEEGVELNLGAYVYRNWKRTTLALNYAGNFRHYTQSVYDGTDQLLALVLTHQLSKHVEITLRTQAGTYSFNVPQPNGVGLVDNNYLQTPQNDLFYNPVFYVSTSGDLLYRMTARLSVRFGGEGDVVRRRASALYGVTSSAAHADMEYRVTRHTTVGLDYRFNHLDFTGQFGSSNIHSVGLNFSRQLTRHMQVSARVGGARVETTNLEQVPIDPAVAVLIGETVGIQAAYHLNYTPDVSVRLINEFQRGQFSASYTNGVTPGNGVYLTSRSQGGDAQYHYTGIRYWNFGVNGVYSRLSTLAQALRAFDSYGGGVGVTRELGKGLHAVTRLDVRRYNVANFYLHTETRVTFGFEYSPGNVPLAFW